MFKTVTSKVFDADVVDSRDIMDRIEELECLDELDEDETAELAALKEFVDEYDYVDDFKYGAQFIAEEYFVQYCKEMLADCGTIPRDLPEYVAIDWNKTAENLSVDYVDAEFAGVSYYVLSV